MRHIGRISYGPLSRHLRGSRAEVVVIADAVRVTTRRGLVFSAKREDAQISFSPQAVGVAELRAADNVVWFRPNDHLAFKIDVRGPKRSRDRIILKQAARAYTRARLAASSPRRMNFWLVLGGAGAMFAGASLPWVSIQSMFGKVSIPGMDAASPFPFEAHAAATCAVVLGLVAWRLNAALLPTVTGKLIGAAASVLTLATGLYAWRQLTSLGLDDVLSVGWGLVLCVFGAGAALVGISRHIFMSLRH